MRQEGSRTILPPDYQELGNRLAEVGLQPDLPWLWIRALIRDDGGTVTITAHPAPFNQIWQQEGPANAEPAGFGPEWRGYRYEAIGLLHHMGHEGRHFTNTSERLPGHPPLWRSLVYGTDRVTLEAELWWQQAYRPTGDGEPALIAELRWWRGLGGAQPFFRVTLPDNQAPSRKHWEAAQEGRQLLFDRQQRVIPTGMSDADAFEDAVKLGLEWLDDHPTKHPKDFGRPEFTAQRCTGPDATAKWMTDKNFGIKQVQRELARRLQWPT